MEDGTLVNFNHQDIPYPIYIYIYIVRQSVTSHLSLLAPERTKSG